MARIRLEEVKYVIKIVRVAIALGGGDFNPSISVMKGSCITP
jgi:hypothetical protein